MWGLVGRLFGTEKALERTVNGVMSGLDKLVYTQEERAEAMAAERAKARAMVVQWMESTSGQNLARRLLALCITAVWLSLYLLSAVLSLTSIWVDHNVQLMDSAGLIADYAERLNGAVMLILAFYFAAPHMSDIVSASLGKFSKSGSRSGTTA